MSDYRTTLLAENEKLRAEVEHWRERFDENEKAMRSAGKAGMLASEAIRTLDEERDEARAEVERAKRALLAHGFTDCGGVEWKPPLGPHPGTLLAEVERLRAEANARAVEELRLQAEGCDTAAAGWARELKVQTDQAHRDRLESRINQLEGVAFHIRRRIAELSKPAAKESERLFTDKLDAIDGQPSPQEKQRRSFAFGNTSIENARITPAMIDAEAEKLAKESDPAKDDTAKCWSCGGQGYIGTTSGIPGMIGYAHNSCSRCGGTGKLHYVAMEQLKDQAEVQP